MKKPRAELVDDAAALLGLEPADVPHVDDDTPVGWKVEVGWTVRGIAHLCRTCRPEAPPGMVAVYRTQLAATCPCNQCGRRLDEGKNV
jgi:hypothetical protein